MPSDFFGSPKLLKGALVAYEAESQFLGPVPKVIAFQYNPEQLSRRRIWQKVFPQQVPVDDLDYASLSRLELAGGNIKNIALNAAFLAASEGGPLGRAHIMHAARREYAKIDMITEGEWGSYYGMVKS